MKLKRIQLGHAPIPAVYSPGYPRQLGAEEFAALIAPRNRDRARKLALGACAAVALSAGSAESAQRSAAPQDPGEAGRELRVLALLQAFADAHPESGWLSNSSMFPASPSATTRGPAYLPRIPISFGNSAMGMFDAGAARRLAGQIFRAYGIEVENDVVLDAPDVRARLDGADRAHKVAYKLRGIPTGRDMDSRADPEPASTDLDAPELAKLAQDGWKLHVADINGYPLMDGDQMTPTLAYLSGILEFLNTVTTGPDLDLRAVLMGVHQRFPVPSLETLGLGKGSPRSTGGEGSSVEFVLAAPRTLRLEFNAPGATLPLVQKTRGRLFAVAGDAERAKPLSTAGRICALHLPLFVEGSAADPRPLTVKLLQAREGAAEPLAIEARSKLVFAPSTFDAARPFELVFELPAGKYVIFDGLDVSVLRD